MKRLGPHHPKEIPHCTKIVMKCETSQARSHGVALGGKCHPWTRGYQIFATRANFSTIENMRISVTD